MAEAYLDGNGPTGDASCGYVIDGPLPDDSKIPLDKRSPCGYYESRLGRRS